MTLRTALPFALVALSLPTAAQPAAPAAQRTAAVTTYRIDPARSTIVYAMSHPAHDWTGTSRAVSGTLAIANGGIQGGTVAAPIASFDSGNRSRDSNMIEATEGYVHRTVSFQIARVTPLRTPTATANATAEGTLTFHGVRQALRVPVRVERSGNGLRVRGTFDVTLTDFGVDPPRLLGIRTRDRVELTFDLAATPG